jgi:hypothetical protein
MAEVALVDMEAHVRYVADCHTELRIRIRSRNALNSAESSVETGSSGACQVTAVSGSSRQPPVSRDQTARGAAQRGQLQRDAAVDLEIRRKTLGHADQAMTSHYTHIEADAHREAAKAAAPGGRAGS